MPPTTIPGKELPEGAINALTRWLRRNNEKNEVLK